VLTKAKTFTKDTSTKMKNKMDEIGVTYVAHTTVDKISTGSKAVGGYIYEKGKVATDTVN
jgi:hypothetical protein